MINHRIVSHDEWVSARKAFMAKEKELTRLREELARERRELPWEKVDKTYVFDAPEGKVTLADLFAGRSQLIVQHFMFGLDYEEGCPSCSFWSDNFVGIESHLAARDTTFVLVSRGPLDKLLAYRKRKGWPFRWVSSGNTDFNFDYGVSRRPDQEVLAYNYGTIERKMNEHPGISTFLRQDGEIFHTYSVYARGIDNVNAAYQLLDLTAKGRDEEGLPFSMAWVKRHDKY